MKLKFVMDLSFGTFHLLEMTSDNFMISRIFVSTHCSLSNNAVLIKAAKAPLIDLIQLIWKFKVKFINLLTHQHITHSLSPCDQALFSFDDKSDGTIGRDRRLTPTLHL